jgi:hypothetical protein
MGLIRYTQNQSPLSKLPQYKWHVGRAPDVLWLLRQIVWYMHIKREIADRMIEEIESYQGPRLAPGWTTVTQKQVHGPKKAYQLNGQTHVTAASSRDI